jgi:GNAT superfamily N-acetyltransferase
MAMLIRLAGIDDAAAISELIRPLAARYIAHELSAEGAKNLLGSMTPDAIERCFRSNYRYHVAEGQGEVVGVVATRDNHHLFHLFVAESHQRRGLAKRLWAVAKQACLDAGGSGAFTVNSSQFALGVYKKLGFVEASPPVEQNGVVFVPMRSAQVVPWGRSFDEYVRMFALTEDDLKRSILGCADGPAAFNAELTRRGGQIVSCDPLYAHSSDEIEARIRHCFETILEQTRLNADGFVWSSEIPDVDALGKVRMTAMRRFLDDFPDGKDSGRYVAAELPKLAFHDAEFELALCSHFLFLYNSTGRDFHTQSVIELARVAREVRIFPLLQLDGRKSPHLPDVIEKMNSLGHVTELVPVPYEFQRGANEMLRVVRRAKLRTSSSEGAKTGG